LNQPLTAILNNANASRRLLSGETLELDEVREALDDILGDAKRAGDVIHHLRALSKKTEFIRATVDIEDTIREIVSLVQGDLALKNISLALDFNADSTELEGDRIQLQQIIMNLIMNGSESTMASGKSRKELTIRTSNDDEDYIQVAICDNGIGIKPEIENNLFCPFFTSKPEGMGMGLTICRSIIEMHQGQIWASNNSNEGATFYFSLPRKKVEMKNERKGRQADSIYSR
jgi:two-component system sensor kinase FixL